MYFHNWGLQFVELATFQRIFSVKSLGRNHKLGGRKALLLSIKSKNKQKINSLDQFWWCNEPRHWFLFGQRTRGKFECCQNIARWQPSLQLGFSCLPSQSCLPLDLVTARRLQVDSMVLLRFFYGSSRFFWFMDRFPEKKTSNSVMVSPWSASPWIPLIFLQAAPCIERDDQRVRRHLEASRHPSRPIRSKGDIRFYFKMSPKWGCLFWIPMIVYNML